MSVSSERSSTATRGEGLKSEEAKQEVECPVSTSLDPWTLFVEPGKHATQGPLPPWCRLPPGQRAASDHPHRRGVRVGVRSQQGNRTNLGETLSAGHDATRPALRPAGGVCSRYLPLPFPSGTTPAEQQQQQAAAASTCALGNSAGSSLPLHHCPDLLTPCRTFARDRPD